MKTVMRDKRLALIAIAGLVIALVLSGCGRRGTFITINGERISKDEFYKRLEQMPVGNPPRAAGLVMLEQMIQDKLAEQLAKEKGVPPTEEQIKKKLDFLKKEGNAALILQQRGMTIDDLKKDVHAQQARVNILTKGIKVSDKETRDYYDQFKDAQFTKTENVEIGVILCKTEDKIKKAYDQVKRGTDFTTVAMTMSEDEVVRRSMGRIGRVWRGQPGVPEDLIEKAFKLKVKEVSEPFQVKGRKGAADWVILKSLSHTRKRVLNFEDVKDQIEEGLALRKAALEGKADLNSMLEKKRKASKININSERYKSYGESLEAEKKSEKSKAK